MAKYDDRDARSRELQDLFRYFSDYRAANYEDSADRWYKLFTGYVEPLGADDDRSNLHIPMTYEAVSTWQSRLLTSFFGNRRPYFDFLPLPVARISPEEMIANAEKANLAACLYDMQLERNNIVALSNDYFTSRLVFPAAILGVGWKREEKVVKRRKPKHIPADAEGLVDQVVLEIQEEKLVTFDDNQIELINFMDFWTDPMGKTFDSSRGCFHREFMSKRELENLLDNYRDVFHDIQEGTVYKLNLADIRSSGFHPQNSAFDRVSFYGENPPDDYNKYRDDAAFELFEVLHWWTDDEHSILVNGQHLVVDGPNHFWRHGKKPFVVGSFEPLPGKIVGMSAVQIIEHLQAERNTMRNQEIDMVAQMLNPMFEVARGADIDESELIWRRNGLIHVDQVGRSVNQLRLDVSQGIFQALQQENRTRDDAQNALAVPDVVRGVQAARKQTATEVATQTSNASIRFDVKIKLFEHLGLKQLAYLCDCNNQQFIDDSRLIKIHNQADIAKEWQYVDPQDILGEWDYRPAGTSTDPAANKEIRKAQTLELFAMFKDDPDIKAVELKKEIFASSDLRTPDKFFKTDDEKAQEQQEQAALMKQIQQQMMQMQQVQQQQTQQMEVEREQRQQEFELLKLFISKLEGGESNAQEQAPKEKGQGKSQSAATSQ